jgi:sugar fermentation stimulation protein A
MPPDLRLPLIHPALEGRFVDRPNRFLARVELAGNLIPVHCPNPGRLRELLLPGSRVVLEEKAESPGRKTRFTLAGVYYRDRLVPLVSARTNLIAERLIIPRLFPDCRAVEREVSQGGSRFDFRVTVPSGAFYLEVKGCTLVEHGVALFPDAPTLRGAKHLMHLAEASKGIPKPAILFVILQPSAALFMPNIHTDPHFSRLLIEASRSIAIHAVTAEINPSGLVRLKDTSVRVDLERTAHHLAGGGCYLLVLQFRRSLEIKIGALGLTSIRKGHYVYVGSAAKGLDSRLARHLRKRKALHWHIDFLTERADRSIALPIRTANSLECRLSRAMSVLSHDHIPGFGCSDCACPSHLYYFPESPLQERNFLDLLARFRHREALARVLN